jgi:hypothetical protein
MVSSLFIIRFAATWKIARRSGRLHGKKFAGGNVFEKSLIMSREGRKENGWTKFLAGANLGLTYVDMPKMQ